MNGPRELANLIFEEFKLPVQSKAKSGYSTDASVIEAFAFLHEVPKPLLEHHYRSKLIVQVHDEVLLDCPREEAQAVQALTVKVLEGAMKLDIPLRVNAALGENWMEI